MELLLHVSALMAPNQLLGGRCAKLRVGAKRAFGRPMWCVGGGGCQFRKSFRPRNWPQPTHRRCTVRCFNILDMRPCCLTLGSLKVQQGASEHITQVESSGESAYKIRIPSRALVLNVFYFSLCFSWNNIKCMTITGDFRQRSFI